MYKLLNNNINVKITKQNATPNTNVDINMLYKIDRKDVFFKVQHNCIITYKEGLPVWFTIDGESIDASIITMLLNKHLFTEYAKMYSLLGEYSISYVYHGYHYVITFNESDLVEVTTNTNSKTLPIRVHKSKSIAKLLSVAPKVTKFKESNQLEIFSNVHYNVSHRYFNYLDEFKIKHPNEYEDILFMLKKGSYKNAFYKMLTAQFASPNWRKDHQFNKLFIKLNGNPIRVMLYIMQQLHN